MVKFALTATIPVYQYANLQPTIETEAETFEQAKSEALQQMKQIWDQVAEGGKKLETGTTPQPNNAAWAVKVCDFTANEVLMDEANHTYQDTQGNKYLSGSSFAHRYEKPFDAKSIGTAYASKHGVDVKDILSMWQTNAEASTSLGTAIHAALELYGKYLQLSEKTKGSSESALHKNPILAPIVTQFFAGREKEEAMYEAFVVDTDKHLCGFIDRLLIVDKEKKIVRVQDYKTNPDINKKKQVLAPFKDIVEGTSLGLYWLQLSFYAYILTQAGYTVEGLDIFNYDGKKWVTYTHDVIDIGSELK